MKRQERISTPSVSSPESLPAAAAAPSSRAVGDPSSLAVGAPSSRAAGAPADGCTASSPIDVDIVRTKVPRKPRTPRLPVVLCLEDDEEDEEVEATSSRSGASREESSHSITRMRKKTPAGIPIINCENSDENDSPKRQDVMKSLPKPPTPKESTFTCPICMQSLEDASVTKCGHIFCEKCIKMSIKRNKKCPLCAHKLTMRGGCHRIYFPASE